MTGGKHGHLSTDNVEKTARQALLEREKNSREKRHRGEAGNPGRSSQLTPNLESFPAHPEHPFPFCRGSAAVAASSRRWQEDFYKGGEGKSERKL